MSALIRFLYPLPTSERTASQLLKWWERRRLPYNLAVGAAGLTSLAVVDLLGMLPPHPHPFQVPVVGIVVYGVLANVCFTGGWLIDSALALAWKDEVRPAGPALFRQGLIFSVGLTLLPIVVATVDWALRLVGALVLR